jgi:hypothetical protein
LKDFLAIERASYGGRSGGNGSGAQRRIAFIKGLAKDWHSLLN